jgi:5-methylcytosine-specific restriction endonuclease McrA
MEKSIKEFIQEKELELGYLYCERCKSNQNIDPPHHIRFRSEFPRHKNLNDHRNLIILCRKCHDFFHGKGKDGLGNKPTTKKEDRLYLIKERNLNELFKTTN